MKNNFWTFSDEQKSMFVAQTSERVGLPPQAVEKDWWVTMTLKALFESSCRDFITFKGGTSLSKGWHVIERFSEDIDIAIDKSFWRIAGDNKSQRDRIRKLSRAYIPMYSENWCSRFMRSCRHGRFWRKRFCCMKSFRKRIRASSE